MYEIFANVAGAFGLAAGFTMFSNLSLHGKHRWRSMLIQFLLLFVPFLALALWVQMPASEAWIMGGTGGAIAVFFAVGLAIVRNLERGN